MIAAVYRRFGAPQVVPLEKMSIPPVHRVAAFAPTGISHSLKEKS
jgi:hypothetical protein